MKYRKTSGSPNLSRPKEYLKLVYLRVLNAFRTRTLFQRFLLVLLFAFPTLFYVWIVNYHRLSNLRDIGFALQTMTLPRLEGDHRCRHMNATHYKCLPNTFFIGASKCGTTSLVEYLHDLPGVAFVNRRITLRDHHREIHRFDRKGFAYSSKFLELADEWGSSPEVRDPRQTVVHYTPNYLYSVDAPQALKQFYPSPLQKSVRKFIILLRNPVHRALSSYWFSRCHLLTKSGRDEGSLEELEQVLLSEMSTRRAYEKCVSDEAKESNIRGVFGGKAQNLETEKKCFKKFYEASDHSDQGHINKGIYVDQLGHWMQAFPPHGQADGEHDSSYENKYFITSPELLRKKEEETTAALLRFLRDDSAGVAREAKIGEKSHLSEYHMLETPNSLAKAEINRPSPQFMQQLQDFYTPYNNELARFLFGKLGLSLSLW